MILIKNKSTTLYGVLKNMKHASAGIIHGAYPGELILVQQTKDALKQNEKSIRWIMEFDSIYQDANNESNLIWGEHWNYIVKCRNIRQVEPFNISEVQTSTKSYGHSIRPVKLEVEDEVAVLAWLELTGDNLNIEDESEMSPELEFSPEVGDSYDLIIKQYDKKYNNAPDFKNRIVKYCNRPSGLRNAIIAREGTCCKICGQEGFVKKNGGRYCELHHMIEISNLAPKTLQSWNLLVLCPTCHKKMHYSNVVSEYLNPGWKIYIDGKVVELM